MSCRSDNDPEKCRLDAEELALLRPQVIVTLDVLTFRRMWESVRHKPDNALITLFVESSRNNATGDEHTVAVADETGHTPYLLTDALHVEWNA